MGLSQSEVYVCFWSRQQTVIALKKAEEGEADKIEPEAEVEPAVPPRRTVHWVDLVARFAFFVGYSTFLVAYVIYYKNVED